MFVFAKRFEKSVVLAIALLVSQSGNFAACARADESQPKMSTANQPILIELFTSEGCSSCPPADILLSHLQNSSSNISNVVVLSEHVDYWNYLGWQDPYSSQQFTVRQHEYARALRQNSVFTPEAVIDGVYGINGSDSKSLGEAIRQCSPNTKALLNVISRDIDGDLKVKVTVSLNCPTELNNKSAELFVAITEDNLSTKVRSGENSGATLPHTGVVRILKKIDQLAFGPSNALDHTVILTLNPEWKKKDLRIVAFLQDPTTKRIYGVGQTKNQNPGGGK